MAGIAAAFSSLVVEIKSAALPKLIGLVQPLLADVEAQAGSVVEQKVEQLLHYLASLPLGSELVVLAEGWGVKVVGNGLPQHGAGSNLLSALQEALGIPATVQPPASPEQVAAQSTTAAAGNAPVPPVIQPATPTVPTILHEAPAKESIVSKVEGVLAGILSDIAGAGKAAPPVPGE
jgi:hypothetical protein